MVTARRHLPYPEYHYGHQIEKAVAEGLRPRFPDLPEHDCIRVPLFVSLYSNILIPAHLRVLSLSLSPWMPV
jgi:hypothetical protein